MERKSVNTLTETEVDWLAFLKTIYGNKGVSTLPEKFAIVLSLLFLFSFHGFTQSKYEKEFRIQAENVPSRALSFVDSLTFDSKVKWYKEIGIDIKTIEVKAKLKKERHSIEFSETGTFQDVEIEVKPNKIPDSTNSKITRFLTLEHKKYKIEKVQIQYTGDRNVVLNFLRSNRNNSACITVNYEVIISTKMDGNYLILEYLFSETGEYVQRNQIISRRKDTLEY